MKRLSALAPDLDIFGSRYVLRDETGWQLTEAGYTFLASIEVPASETHNKQSAPLEVVLTLAPARHSPAPPLRLVVDNRQGSRPAPKELSNRSWVA
jgi:hypothetical protein